MQAKMNELQDMITKRQARLHDYSIAIEKSGSVERSSGVDGARARRRRDEALTNTNQWGKILGI
jgi:hypothetical protein